VEWGSEGDEQGGVSAAEGRDKREKLTPKRVRKEFVAAVEREKNRGQQEDAVVLRVNE